MNKPDQALVTQLQDLKNMVETIVSQPDIALRGGVYKELTTVDVLTTIYNNFEVGYKVQQGAISNLRKIFVKVNDYLWSDIPQDQREPVMVAVFDVFLDRSQAAPEITQISPQCVLLQQHVVPLECRMSECATIQ